MCAGCGKVTEEPPKVSLDETKMRSICKLATLDCYYHNVAKYKEEDVSGFLWWKKDKIFWISYGGIVTLGIDADAMQVKIDGSNVEIAIPEVKVCSKFSRTIRRGSNKSICGCRRENG